MRGDRFAKSFRILVAIGFVVSAMLPIRPAAGALAPGGCVDFEDLTLATVYNVSDVFSDSGVSMTASQFQWSNGTWTSGGFARVQGTGLAGGTGLDLQLNNITVNFDFGRPVEDLVLFFGEYGGNVNLTVNGDFKNVIDLADLDAQMVGGTYVEVAVSPPGFGVLVITGVVNSFSIGGQELWIDDVCDAVGPTGECIEFEDLPLGEQYDYGRFFADSGVGMLVEEFSLLPSGSTTAGHVLVDNTNKAGGTGQDVYPNNVNIVFFHDGPLAEISLLYSDLGGNVNLMVNDDLANTWDFVDLHNTTLGDATVSLDPPSGFAGTLTVTGYIESFAIGGQETWIDDVCVIPAEIFSDGFESGNTTAWSTTIGGP
jgi:hypothetical protein